jgi:hypothetical protein
MAFQDKILQMAGEERMGVEPAFVAPTMPSLKPTLDEETTTCIEWKEMPLVSQ